MLYWIGGGMVVAILLSWLCERVRERRQREYEALCALLEYQAWRAAHVPPATDWDAELRALERE